MISRLRESGTIISGLIISIVAIILLNLFFARFEERQIEQERVRLENQLTKTVIEFEKGIEKFASIVAGLRSHLKDLNREPQVDDVQRFLTNQLEYINLQNTLVVSYLDTSQTFIFSCTKDDSDPNGLAGIQLSEIRDAEAIRRINILEETEGIFLFPPINLIEKYAGLPVNFRQVVNNEVKGTVTPLVDVREIINPIYEKDLNNEFAYAFYFQDSVEFDREVVYDGFKIYNESRDSLNLHLDRDQFLIDSVSLYGMDFSVGIAYKEGPRTSPIFAFLEFSAYVLLLLLILSSILYYLLRQNAIKNKRLERRNLELDKKNIALKRFVSASSHDLKQPLRNIQNFTGLYLERYKNTMTSDGSKFMGFITENADYMDQLLDDLMVYSKLISDTKSQREWIDIEDIVEELKHSYESEEVLIKYKGGQRIYGMRSEIKRLFQNLIGNSVIYNDSTPKKIEISSASFNGSVKVQISDNGIGIDKKYHTLVFEEFQRIEKNGYSGTGLGLSICKEIVGRHGGKIWMESEIGKGSDVYFTIPTYDR